MCFCCQVETCESWTNIYIHIYIYTIHVGWNPASRVLFLDAQGVLHVYIWLCTTHAPIRFFSLTNTQIHILFARRRSYYMCRPVDSYCCTKRRGVFPAASRASQVIYIVDPRSASVQQCWTRKDCFVWLLWVVVPTIYILYISVTPCRWRICVRCLLFAARTR